MKKKALWFTRHQPTDSQLTEISQMGYELVRLTDGLALGSVSITDDETAMRVFATLMDMGTREGADVVFGVIPTPIRALLREADQRPSIYESWNINRSQEGKPPAPIHHKWVRTM